MSIQPAARVRALQTYVFTRVKDAAGIDSNNNKFPLIDLSVGDPDEGVRQEILKEAFRFALRDASYARYPSGRGLLPLRKAIAKWMDERYGVNLDPETEIAVISGSKEGLAHLASALLNPGDKVLIGSCAYPVYERASGLAGAQPVYANMEEKNGFLADFSACGPARAAFFNYPNNPTGAAAPFTYFRDLTVWARRTGTFLVSDAAYSEVYFDPKNPPTSLLSVPEAKKQAVEFHSFSKSFGLPGLRLGWVCGSAEAIAALLKLKDTYDSGVSNFIQAAGLYLLQCPERDRELARLRSLYGGRRKLFEKGLRALHIPFFSSSATFYVFSSKMKGDFHQRLGRARISTVPGSGFGPGSEGRVRFALCVPASRLNQAILRLKKSV